MCVAGLSSGDAVNGTWPVVVDPDTQRMVVLREEAWPRVVISGFQGPPGTGAPVLTGAKAIAVVAALPGTPDPDTVYITTT